MSPRGKEVRLYFSSADASTAARIVLYDADGNIFASTKFGAGSGVEMATPKARLHITDLTLINGNATVQLFSDHNDDGTVDAGENMISFPVSSTTSMHFLGVPLMCLAGDLPKIKASGAAQIDLVGTGFLTRA